MQLVDYDLTQTWWFTYRVKIPGLHGGQQITYGRMWRGYNPDKYENRAKWLDGILPEGRGLIVGTAFGFTQEELTDLGRDVWGVDTSEWIHAGLESNARQDMVGRILKLDITDPGDYAELIDTAGDFAWVLTEEVMSAYDDVGAHELGMACAKIAPVVAHIINLHVQKPFNSQPLQHWESILPGQACFNPSGGTS